MKITANPLVVKIVRCLSICTASAYLTFLVDIFTLNTALKRVFVFSYFVLMCALFLYLKKRFLKTAGEKRSVRYTAVIFVVAASVLMVFQDSFLPPVRSNLITLQADNSGEVWLIEAAIDGESVPLSQLDVEKTANWQYSAAYDDYVYYPEENPSYNGLTLDIAGNDVKLSFGVNSWSGSVLITNTEGETETIVLHAEDAQQSQFTYAETGERLYSVGERILFNLGALVILVFFLNVIADVLMRKAARSVSMAVSTFDKFFLILNIMVAVITIAIFAPQFFYEGNEFTVTITSLNERNSSCQGYEMGIGVRANEKSVLPAYRDAGWMESGSRYLCTVPDQTITFTLNSADDNKLILAQHMYAAKIRVDYFENSTVLDLYSPDAHRGEWSFDKKLWLKSPLDILCGVIIIAAVLLTSSLLMTQLFHSVRAGTAFSTVLLFVVLLSQSAQLQYQYYIILTFSIFSCFHLMSNKGKYIREYLAKRAVFVVVILVSAYTAFALFGFELFLSEEFWNTSAESAISYLCLSVILIPLVLQSLEVLERISSYVRKRTDLKPTKEFKHFRFGCFLIMSIPMIVGCIVCYPANMTSDQVDQWIQARGYIPIQNAHPAIHTLFLRLCSKIFPSPVTVTIIQSILLAFVMSSVLNKCRKKGISYKVLFGIATVFSVAPSTIAMITSITKNVMFAISLLWTIYLLMELFDDPVHFFRSPVCIFQSLIVLPFVHMVRNNAFVVLPIVAAILLYLTIKHFKEIHIRPVLLMVAVMLTVAVVRGPVYDWFGVQRGNGGGVPVSLSTPFVVALKVGVELPEDTVDFLEKILPEDEFIQRYSPYNADIFCWKEPRPDYSKVTVSEALKHYLILLCRRPDIVIKDRLDMSNLSWDVFSHPGVKHDRYVFAIWGSVSLIKYMEAESQTFIPERKIEGYVYRRGSGYLADMMADYLGMFNELAVLNSIIWRNGIYLILMLIIGVFALKEKNYKIMVLESIPLAVLATLILVFGCQMYQYFWFFPMCTFSICLYMLSDRKAGTPEMLIA